MCISVIIKLLVLLILVDSQLAYEPDILNLWFLWFINLKKAARTEESLTLAAGSGEGWILVARGHP